MALRQGDIRFPQWGGWENWLPRVEDRIESALSSSNGFLNTFLSPVRNFVGFALHPLFNLGDIVWHFGVDVAHAVENLASDMGWDLLYAMAAVYNDAVGVTQWLVGAAVGKATDLFHQAEADAAAAIRLALGGVETIVGDVRDFASSLYWKAIAFAVTVANDATAFTQWIVGQAEEVGRRAVQLARDDLGAAIHFLAGATSTLIGAAIDFAKAVEARAIDFAKAVGAEAEAIGSAALDALRRDVLGPLGGAFHSFLDNEWHWAMQLLKLLEDAAEWLAWTGTHLVPATVDLYKFLRDLQEPNLETLVRWGAAIGAP